MLAQFIPGLAEFHTNRPLGLPRLALHQGHLAVKACQFVLGAVATLLGVRQFVATLAVVLEECLDVHPLLVVEDLALGVMLFGRHLRFGLSLGLTGGFGRSGLVGKCFAMRLKHLGKEVYVVGETICPAIEKGDVLVAVSFSGNRFGVLHAARVARDSGAVVVSLTSSTGSELIKLSDTVIRFPDKGVSQSVQAGNSLFEQSVFLFLEAFILFYQRKAHIRKAVMKKVHTNLE